MCVCVCGFLCVVCAVCFVALECVCVCSFGMYCVMMYGSFSLLCMCVSFNVFVCGVCGIVCDAVWCVLWGGSVACLCVVSFMCSWVVFVIHCVVMYGLVLCVLCLVVSVPCELKGVVRD